MTEHTRQLTKLFIRILITTGLLVWVFSRIDLQQLGSTIKTARWGFLAIIWVLAIISFWTRAIKMRLILKKQHCDVKIGTIFGASAVTSLYSMIMPGPLSTGVKWYILKQHTGKGSNVLSGMVYNQLTEIVVMIALGLAGLTVVNIAQGWKLSLFCSILLIAIIVGSVLVLSPRTGPKLSTYLTYLLKLLPGWLHKKAEELLQQILIFQTVSWRFHLNMAFITVFCGILSVIIYILAAKSADINVPTGVFVWQCALIYILGRFPISVANLGIREFTLVGTLAQYGVAAPQALLMSMIIFSCAIFMAIIGAIYQLSWAVNAKKSA